MKLYNIYYKVKNQVTEKKNMTKEEVDEFISKLKQENECELRVSQVKDREEDERYIDELETEIERLKGDK